MTTKEQMKDLAKALLQDVNMHYEEGDYVKIFNSLNRLKTGAEAILALAQTAEILDNHERILSYQNDRA